MTQKWKIGILRGRNDVDALPLDQACWELLVTSTNPPHEAVREYWTDNTDYILQFDVTMMPWVDVTFTSADADSNGMISGFTQFSKVEALTKNLPGFEDLSAYDGFICLIAPGRAFANSQANLSGQPAILTIDCISVRQPPERAHCAVFP